MNLFVSIGVAVSAAAISAATKATVAAVATVSATSTTSAAVVTGTAVALAVGTVAATTTSVLIAPIEDVVAPVIIRTTCGLPEPQPRRIGKFSMGFEGFNRTLDERESSIMEGLVLEAYNTLTVGPNIETEGRCLDPLSREMEEVKVLNQNLYPSEEGQSAPVLEVDFETRIVCDNCLASRPLFKNDKEQGELSQSTATATSRLLRSEQSPNRELQLDEELASFDISGASFFHRLIQRVIFETEELSEAGELPGGFVKVSQAFVTPTGAENGAQVDDTTAGGSSSSGSSSGNTGGTTSIDSGSSGGGDSGGTNSGNDVVDSGSNGSDSEGGTNDVNSGNSTNGGTDNGIDTGGTFGSGVGSASQGNPLFVQVQYAKQQEGEKAAFAFTYVDEESGTVVMEAVIADPDPAILPIPASLFPTMLPSSQPSLSFVPSTTPSFEPTGDPSQSPSFVPSFVPSDSPSSLPSYVPSEIPSDVPSELPSFVPSESPSDVPSFIPSEVPSEIPSFIPSEVPSEGKLTLPLNHQSCIHFMSPISPDEKSSVLCTK